MTRAGLLLLVLLQLSPLAAQEANVGSIAFPNSGAPEAQEAFHYGVAQLHNFEYASAAEAFRRAQEIDPGFALAYWGEAMTHNHPVWMEQDREAARAVLARLGDTPEARRARAPTDRERGLLDAIEVLYGEGDKHDRDFAYEEAMSALHREYPDDPDITALYALSILGTAHEGRDFATYMRAAAVAETAFDDHPRHPGLAHYLIHSYDDPIHAPLGMRAANVYADIAPEAAHAQHMTSHIFVASGLWERVVAANETAAELVNARLEAGGREPYHCGHYNHWLLYGYTQLEKDFEAAVLLDLCREIADAGTPERSVLDPDYTALASFLAMRARYVIDTEDWTWGNVADVPEFPDTFVSERITMHYTNALAAAFRGDVEGFRDAAEAFSVAHDELPAFLEANPDLVGGSPLERAAVLDLQLRGLRALADGDVPAGIALLSDAATVESEIPLMFGPPFVDKPSYELLGEVLLELGAIDDAEAAFRQQARLTPNRRAIVRGLERIETQRQEEAS